MTTFTTPQDRDDVVKSNQLILSSYELSLSEQWFMLTAISKIDPYKPFNSDAPLRVDANDMSRFVMTNNAYAALRTAVDELFDDEFTTTNEDGNQVRHRWLQNIAYIPGEGAVELVFTADAAKFLYELKKNYTRYSRNEVVGFASAYSIRIYEWMMQWRNVGHFTQSVPRIRHMLQLTEKYPQFAELRRNVLEVARKDINRKSPYNLELSYVKRWKTVEEVRFDFKPKPAALAGGKVVEGEVIEGEASTGRTIKERADDVDVVDVVDEQPDTPKPSPRALEMMSEVKSITKGKLLK